MVDLGGECVAYTPSILSQVPVLDIVGFFFFFWVDGE